MFSVQDPTLRDACYARSSGRTDWGKMAKLEFSLCLKFYCPSDRYTPSHGFIKNGDPQYVASVLGHPMLKSFCY